MSFILKFWPYLLGGLLLVGLAGGSYVKGRNAGVAATEARWQAKWDQAEADALKRIRAAEAAYGAEKAERERLAAVLRDLPPPPPPKTLIREVPTDGPVTSCPRLSPDFRVHFNADPARSAEDAASLVSE